MHQPRAHFFFALILFLSCGLKLMAQPFLDPFNANSQFFHTTYKDSLHLKNTTRDYTAAICIPKKFKNENTFLVRLSGEKLESKREETTLNLYSLSMPMGFQFVNKKKNWKAMFMGIPRISSDFRDNLKKDWQYGGMMLFTYVCKDTLLKLKFGLFYNKESFGNFFVPLVGIDWKVNNRLSIYGILPNNFRMEERLLKNIYVGVGFKNYKRSYRLCSDLNDGFVTVKETQVKCFAEFYLRKHVAIFGDLAYVLKYDFGQFAEDDLKMKSPLSSNPVYSPMNGNFIFTCGLAYRMRLD